VEGLGPLLPFVDPPVKAWAAEFSGLRANQVFGPFCKATNRSPPDLLISGRGFAPAKRSAAAAINSSTSSLRKGATSLGFTSSSVQKPHRYAKFPRDRSFLEGRF